MTKARDSQGVNAQSSVGRIRGRPRYACILGRTSGRDRSLFLDPCIGGPLSIILSAGLNSASGGPHPSCSSSQLSSQLYSG
jgi:hypothetical protein